MTNYVNVVKNSALFSAIALSSPIHALLWKPLNMPATWVNTKDSMKPSSDSISLTFIINGKFKIVGAQPVDVFKQIFDKIE